MLTSRIQHTTPRLSPAALEAAATAFLAEAEGVSARVIHNRGWRAVIQQGPSADGLLWNGRDPETFEDNENDLGIGAGGVFRTADDRPAPGNFARSLDRYQWNAIRVLAPHIPDRDVLTLSASLEFGGRGSAKRIGAGLGLSGRMIRKIQDQHAEYAKKHLDPAALIAALDADLPPDDVVVPRRAPSRRGRKPRGAPISLVLAPQTPAPPPPRARAPRPCRARPGRGVCPGQISFFDSAA